MLQRLLFVFTLLFLPVCAQETAQITGRIVDPSGSVVPGVAVEILNIHTNVKWGVRTNADGYYTQALLLSSIVGCAITSTVSETAPTSSLKSRRET